MSDLPPVGRCIEAFGLQSQPHLNGLQAEVIGHQASPDASSMLLIVKFSGSDRPVALKPQNARVVVKQLFKIGDTVEAHGLQDNHTLNGCKGKVVQVQQDTNTVYYTTDIPEHGVTILKQQNTRAPAATSLSDFPNGTTVEAHGLTQRQTLNNQVGTVISHQPPDLLVVQFAAPHGTLALKPKNVRKTHRQPAQVSPSLAPAGFPTSNNQSPEARNNGTPSTSPGGLNQATDFPVGTDVEACYLQSKSSMNGSKGTVVGHRLGNDGSTQVIVRFPIHGTLALLPGNLKRVLDGIDPPPPASPTSSPNGHSVVTQFPMNSTVQAHSLQQQVSLNGVSGLVVGHQPTTGQVVVQFPPQFGTMTLRGANLKAGSQSSSKNAFHGYDTIRRHASNIKAEKLPVISCESWLDKKTPAVGRDSDRRYFTLRGSTLIYYEEKGRIVLTPQHIVEQVANDDKSFSLLGPGMSRKFELRSDTVHDKDSWCKALKNFTRAQATAQSSLRRLEAVEVAGRFQIYYDWAAHVPRLRKPVVVATRAQADPADRERAAAAQREAAGLKQANAALQEQYAALSRNAASDTALAAELERQREVERSLRSTIEQLQAQLREAREQASSSEPLALARDEIQQLSSKLEEERAASRAGEDERTSLKRALMAAEAAAAAADDELQELRAAASVPTMLPVLDPTPPVPAAAAPAPAPTAAAAYVDPAAAAVQEKPRSPAVEPAGGQSPPHTASVPEPAANGAGAVSAPPPPPPPPPIEAVPPSPDAAPKYDYDQALQEHLEQDHDVSPLPALPSVEELSGSANNVCFVVVL
ncbi:hypothetical protein DIPPA_33574 [Diplonema papillatum]|nr:hypothetical protein DIPPA_33574 [Diplonema papillatum]